MDGIINLLKPPCMTSAQAVSFVKRLTGNRVGHAGTLDPDACGVLPIMVGKATRLFDYLTEKDKVYVAELAFGAATDTQDASGRVIASSDAAPTVQEVRGVLPRFVGRIAQVPPQYSALKREGKAMYEWARRGDAPVLDARPIDVHAIDYLHQMPGRGHLLRIRCGKGTYIRTLCHDIGQALGCPAHMRMLIRTQSGPFHLEEAITLEALAQLRDTDALQGPWLHTADRVLSAMRRVDANPEAWARCINGAKLWAYDLQLGLPLARGERVALYCLDQLVGVHEWEGEQLRPRTMLYMHPQTSPSAIS